jgi:sugar phosphate isomerase/epimerase
VVIHLTHGFKVKDVNTHGIALLKRLVGYANGVGIQIAVENTKNNGVIEKVLQEIEDPTLGLCFDTSHDNLYGQNKFELMVKYRDRLLCLHISDNNGLADDHWVPYQGKIDWNGFIKKFPKSYNGILNLEVVSKNKDTSSVEFLKNAYEVIKDIEDRIQSQKAVTT